MSCRFTTSECKSVSVDPGCARLGNFVNYYQFNPPEKRVQHIPKQLLADFCTRQNGSFLLALDVGCNSGVSFLLQTSQLVCILIGRGKIEKCLYTPIFQGGIYLRSDERAFIFQSHRAWQIYFAVSPFFKNYILTKNRGEMWFEKVAMV